MAGRKQNVAVVGASPKADRYSNRAVRMLAEHGHTVFPINPNEESIESIPVVPDLGRLTRAIASKFC
jgi:uncharacterized protein